MQLEELQELIHEFLLTIDASGNVVSDETLAFNERRILLFVRFVAKHKIDDPLTPRAFRRYSVYLKRRPRFDGKEGPLSPYYRRGCMQVLKRFGTWLYLEEYTDRDLGQVITLPRLPRDAPPKAITLQDMEEMIGGCCGFTESAIRNQAILVTLRDTGCRAQELVGMTWGNVDLFEGQILVTGKGQKSRYVFLTVDAIILLRAYREMVPHEPEDAVWWTHGRYGDQRPLTYRGLYSFMYRTADRAGVKGRWNPHSWRHAYGRDMVRAGVPTLALADMMGHSTPEITMIYTKMDTSDLKAIYDERSPHAYRPEEEEHATVQNLL